MSKVGRGWEFLVLIEFQFGKVERVLEIDED